MKQIRATFLLIVVSVLSPVVVNAQSVPDFDMTAYKAFLAAHLDMSSDQLLALHPASYFQKDAPTTFSTALHFPAIDAIYKLTPDERALLGQHGFVVTERIRPKTFASAFLEIYKADLPVFISTDAILHALHLSYDLILERIEYAAMIPKLRSALTTIHAQIPVLAMRYAQRQEMEPSLSDVDLYLTVARRLLGQTVVPFYISTLPASNDLLQKIAEAQWEQGAKPLFADSLRLVDYSQFTVRGHYTHSEELSRYFQSLMWLGRTEFYLSPPTGTEEQYTEAQIQRQAIAALLLREAVMLSEAETSLSEIDGILRFFVGDPDNVTLNHLTGLVADVGMAGADEMLDTLKFRGFQSALLEHAWAYQRILSQMLCSRSPLATEQIQPASSFLLLGQRFIIDSYVTGSVVYDKIVYQNTKIKRMLPSTQDVLFALGNDASGQLLVPELDQYHYATNLAALRYLIDAYEPQFWRTTIYNGWLNAIRALNPPRERAGLPPFMQTAAWWQEKMNTQMASWAELRHDNLLYAKQSYTGIPACMFPYGYVEPIPEFYRRLSGLADTAAAYFRHLTIPEVGDVAAYFVNMKKTADTLAAIAEKELSKIELDESEKGFLSRTIYLGPCGSGRDGFPNGWYADLSFGAPPSTTEDDIVVADVHTSPANASGAIVGWVLHAGTGPLNMAFVVTELPQIGNVAFVGPVLSYYEYVSSDFKRLTDEEWKAQYAGLQVSRPSWANLYLANQSGTTLGTGPTLITGIPIDPVESRIPQSITLAQNYPNPFNPSTTIRFELPGASSVRLKLYNVMGQEVLTLVDEEMPAGVYDVRFNGSGLSSGVYFYRMQVRPPASAVGRDFKSGAGDFVQTKRLMLLK